jgi:hypothetical protein
MANYQAARAVHKTLAAAAQDVVTLSATTSVVEVINRSTTDTIFGTAGTIPASSVPDATVAGDDTFAVPPGGVRTIAVAQQDEDLVVKLIAASATAYSIQVGGQ